MKRKLAILLFTIMLTVTSAGCGEAAESALPTAQVAWENSPSYRIDFDAAFTAFSPDTVMINAGDYVVTWAELFFYIRGNINALFSSFGEIGEWSEALYGNVSFAETVLNFAVESALTYKAVEYGAKLSGISLSQEVLDSLREDFEDMASNHGGEEELLRLLWEEDGCYSRELFEYLVRTGSLTGFTFSELFGDNGEKLSDADASALTEKDGYIMAKHILRLKKNSDNAELEETEEILRQLNAYGGGDFDAFFDTLSQAHSEDSGLTSYPNGYLYQNGDVDQAFYEASAALDIGTYSEIVESSYGYHIIYRVQIDFDQIPVAFSMRGDSTTLRHFAALGMFERILASWLDELAPQNTDEFDSIDMAAIFLLHDD